MSHFSKKKSLEKWDTLGKLTQKLLFLDYNKQKRKKNVTLWSHGLYIRIYI